MPYPICWSITLPFILRQREHWPPLHCITPRETRRIRQSTPLLRPCMQLSNLLHGAYDIGRASISDLGDEERQGWRAWHHPLESFGVLGEAEKVPWWRDWGLDATSEMVQNGLRTLGEIDRRSRSPFRNRADVERRFLSYRLGLDVTLMRESQQPERSHTGYCRYHSFILCELSACVYAQQGVVAD
jgi:hypothetical protein